MNVADSRLSFVDPRADNRTISTFEAILVLLAALAWTVCPGISVAICCYGALLASGHLLRVARQSPTRSHRAIGYLALALSWLVVLTFAAAVLPSNFSAALL